MSVGAVFVLFGGVIGGVLMAVGTESAAIAIGIVLTAVAGTIAMVVYAQRARIRAKKVDQRSAVLIGVSPRYARGQYGSVFE